MDNPNQIKKHFLWKIYKNYSMFLFENGFALLFTSNPSEAAGSNHDRNVGGFWRRASGKVQRDFQ